MPTTITPADLAAILESGQPYALFDIRERGEFERGQIFGATSLPRRLVELRLPELVPARTVPIVLYDDDGRRAALTATTLKRLSYQNVSYLEGGLAAWTRAGYDLAEGTNVPSKDFGERVQVLDQVPNVKPTELKRWVDEGRRVVICDVRTPEEHTQACIPGSIGTPGVELALHAADLRKAADAVVVHCAGRTRSIIGAGTLRLMADTPVYALENGTMGWLLAGLDLEKGSTKVVGSPSAESLVEADTFAARLAGEVGVGTLSATGLRSLLDHLESEQVTLIDVRTLAEYEAGHVPGAQAVPGGQVVQRADDFIAVRNAPVVLVDDGGPRAKLTGYWLRRLGLPDVRVLDAGLASWSAAGLRVATGRSRPIPLGLDQARERVRAIDAGTLRERLRSDAPLVVLDVDASDSFRRGHVPGARWLPRGWLELRIGDLVANRALPIVTTCRNGILSTFAAATLDELGYADVAVLEGGVQAWLKAGLDIETGLTGVTEEPLDVVLPPYERGREAMLRYLDWEEKLGHKYEGKAT